MKILVVEDEVLLALYFRDILIDSGHEVLGPAQTVAEAMSIVNVVAPDLVLSNINLADGSTGIDLAGKIGIPVLFITVSVHEAQAAKDVALGVIAKPCSPTLLQRSVEIAQTVISGRPVEKDRVPPGLMLFQGASA